MTPNADAVGGEVQAIAKEIDDTKGNFVRAPPFEQHRQVVNQVGQEAHPQRSGEERTLQRKCLEQDRGAETTHERQEREEVLPDKAEIATGEDPVDPDQPCTGGEDAHRPTKGLEFAPEKPEQDQDRREHNQPQPLVQAMSGTEPPREVKERQQYEHCEGSLWQRDGNGGSEDRYRDYP